MFFQHIHQMMTEGVDLTLVIRKKEGQLTVSALPRSNNLKDEAQNHLVPLILTGTPAELDGGFLPTIGRPMQRAAGLVSNMAQFEQQANKAAANSKANKEQKDKLSKEDMQKREKYDKHMKKAEEQIAAKSYPEALTSLQQARLHATEQTTKTVDEKIAEMKALLAQGSLFDIPATPAPQPAVAQPQPVQAAPTPQPIAQPMQPRAPQMPQQQAMSQQQPYYGQQFQQQQQPIQQQWQQPMPGYPQQQQFASPQYAQGGIPSGAYPGGDYQPCSEDEYAQYPDFPANMQPIMSNVQPQTF